MVVSARYDDTPWAQHKEYTFTSNIRDTQCIAPTLNWVRCKVSSSKASGEIAQLHKDMQNSNSAVEIVQKMRQLVLLRCCDFRHNEKLQSRPETRRSIAERYIEEFARLRMLGTSVPKGLNPPDEGSIDGMKIVPYATDPSEWIEDVLRSDVPSEHSADCISRPDSGVVYAFTVPRFPGVVKIGYSGKSASVRMSDLSGCMRDAQLVAEINFRFPERMEKLIHLELQEHRRKISNCDNCFRGHEEFFELSTTDVKLVMYDWQDVVAREPLYTPGRVMTKAWKARLSNETAGITGLKLLKMLDEEQKQRMKQEEERRDVKQEEERLAVKQEQERHAARQEEERLAARQKQENHPTIKQEHAKDAIIVRESPDGKEQPRPGETISAQQTEAGSAVTKPSDATGFNVDKAESLQLFSLSRLKASLSKDVRSLETKPPASTSFNVDKTESLQPFSLARLKASLSRDVQSPKQHFTRSSALTKADTPLVDNKSTAAPAKITKKAVPGVAQPVLA